MGKSLALRNLPSLKSDEVEIPFTAMRRLSPEHFEVVTGLVRGTVTDLKVLEKDVSLVVGRLTAQKSMKAQHEAAVKRLGLAGES